MQYNYKKLFVVFSLLVGMFLISAGSTQLAKAEGPAFKQIASPPSEILAGNVQLPSPTQGGIRSHSAMTPVQFEQSRDGNWHWQGDLLVDASENLSMLVFAPQKSDWVINLQMAGQKSAISLDQALKQGDVTVQDTSLGMGNNQYPAKRYDFNKATVGQWLVSIDSSTASDGYIIVGSKDTSVKLFSHLDTIDLVTGRNIGFVAYAYSADADKDKTTAPALLKGAVNEATLRLTAPSGKVTTQAMVNNNDLFKTSIEAVEAGEYIAQVTVRGTTAQGTPFLRTTQNVFSVVEPVLSLSSQVVNGNAKDDTRLSINLLATQTGETVEKVIARAEVWGTARDGSKAPVAWISGMVIPQQSKEGLVLPMTLDARWISLANVQAPFELRNIAIQDVDTFVPMARLAQAQLQVSNMPVAAKNKVLAITDEMLKGPQPQVKATNAGKLLLVHGYCSGNVWGPRQSQFSNSAVFLDLGQNRSHDQFANQILSFGSVYSSYGIVAHSQGGAAATHLYTYYWSGLDYATGSRLIQSLGTPYQGTSLAGNLAVLGEIFGVGCGTNNNLTYSGASSWLSGIPTWARNKVNYYTTSFTDNWWSYDYCHIASDLLLDDPDDGTTEKWSGQLSSAVNRGHTTGQCHTSGMRDMAQYTDSGRNSTMSANAAR